MTRYVCDADGRRREAVKGSDYNGIDFLEVDEGQTTLRLAFINDVTPATLSRHHFRVEGGERIRDVQVLTVAADANDPKRLDLVVDKPGDFSSYRLRIVDPGSGASIGFGIDPVFSVVDFSFKIHCASDFDCTPSEPSARPEPRPPEIDYLAKDYASFRRLILDRLAVLTPEADISAPADLRMTLVELLAYVGDYLSFQQDATATEAYLQTARRRVSVRRHARLVDYAMHDGANARVWVQIQVRGDNVRIPARTRLCTRLSDQHPGAISEEALRVGPREGVEVFETVAEAELRARHNEIRFYTWGADACCLPRGATRATLRGKLDLKVGDVLIFVEKTGPSGAAADADPGHRHSVRLVAVDAQAEDPLGARLGDPGASADRPLALTEIQWHGEDALPFPLCISSEQADNVAVALGNVVLADHGWRVDLEPLGQVPPIDPVLARVARSIGGSAEPTRENTPPRFRPQLQGTPITCVAPYERAEPDGSPRSARALIQNDVTRCLPAISLTEVQTGTAWRPRRDLLNSDELANEFVVEIESDGTACVRFGDNRYGRRPPPGTAFTASYRVGNGLAGNVGANAIAHVAVGDGLNADDIIWITNPLPAQGGVEPESTEEARARAPYAFRRQERAVMPEDYAHLAARHPEVQQAAARLGWTGSWSTVYIAVDRKGGQDVDAAFERTLRRHLEPFRLAGHDIEIESPRFVPLDIDMQVHVKPGYKRTDVGRTVSRVFSRESLPDGRTGVFHPDRFSFGRPVYLSQLYAAAAAIEGVEAVEIERFQRQGTDDPTPLQTGSLPMGRFEIVRLDNEPNRPERGRFQLRLEGGL